MTPKVTEEYKERKRREILAASQRVFQRKGFEPVTMTDIKEEAQISFGGLYQYYRRTDEIFMDLLQMLNEQAEEQLSSYTPSTVWEELQLFLHEQVDHIQMRQHGIVQAAYEFFLAGWREEKRLCLLKARIEKNQLHIMNLVEKGEERGEFTTHISKEHLSTLLVSTLEGISISSHILCEKDTKIHEQIQALEGMLHSVLQVK